MSSAAAEPPHRLSRHRPYQNTSDSVLKMVKIYCLQEKTAFHPIGCKPLRYFHLGRMKEKMNVVRFTELFQDSWVIFHKKFLHTYRLPTYRQAPDMDCTSCRQNERSAILCQFQSIVSDQADSLFHRIPSLVSRIAQISGRRF